MKTTEKRKECGELYSECKMREDSLLHAFKMQGGVEEGVSYAINKAKELQMLLCQRPRFPVRIKMFFLCPV